MMQYARGVAIAFFALTALAIGPGTAQGTEFLSRAAVDDPHAPPTIEQLFAEPEHWGVSLSPSGRYVSFIDTRLERLRNSEEERPHSRIIVRDLEAVDGQETDRTIDLGQFEARWAHWATDERMLVSVGMQIRWRRSYRNPEVELIETARLMSVPVDAPSEAILLLQTGDGAYMFSAFQTFSDVVDLLPDDPEHILIAAWRRGDYSLWKVNLVTGLPEIAAVGNGDTYAWHTNSEGVPVLRFDVSRRRDEVTVRARNPRSGSWRRIARYRFGEIDDTPPEFDFAGNSDDPEIIYVRGRPDGADRLGVYRYSLSDMAYLEQVGGHERADVSGTLRLGREGRYVGYYVHDERLEMHFDDPRLASAFEIARAAIDPRLEVRPIRIAGERILFLAYGPEEPAEIHVLHEPSGDFSLLTRTLPALSSAQLAAVRTLRYTARDGLEIQAYLTEAQTLRPGTAPLLILPHGGPVARDVYGFDPMAQYLATLGYNVLQPNFRGSTGFGREFTEAGFGQWGEAMQDDLSDGVAWMVDQGLAQADQVCIMGWSYGGYAALMGALETPELYRCAVAGAPVSDLNAQIEHWGEVFERSDYMRNYIRDLYGDPEDDAVSLSENSPINLIESLSVPVLLQHGDSDRRVPVEQSQGLAEAANAAGAPLTYFEYEDAPHTFERAETILMLERSAAFLAEHLPSDRNRLEDWVSESPEP
jgi:dipeptidyl aminopeptidase/acylaminoacyl peptidase